MTKERFKQWLQDRFYERATGDEFDAGDIHRDIDSGEIDLPDGVEMVMNHIGHDIIFKLEDGMLQSNFETGMEDETIWFFCECRVESNMWDYSVGELDKAIDHARAAVKDLEGLKG